MGLFSGFFKKKNEFKKTATEETNYDVTLQHETLSQNNDTVIKSSEQIAKVTEENSDVIDEATLKIFNEQYQQLKDLAPEILRYRTFIPDNVYKDFDIVIPKINRFLEIASVIDEELVLKTFRSEASAASHNWFLSFHPIFESAAYGNDNDWKNVVEIVRSLKSRFYFDTNRIMPETYELLAEIANETVENSKYIIVNKEIIGLKETPENLTQFNAVTKDSGDNKTIINTENGDSLKEFDKQYRLLTELAKDIKPFRGADGYRPTIIYKSFDYVHLRTMKFLDVAKRINVGLAVAKFKQEAAEYDPDAKAPYHKIFCVRANNELMRMNQYANDWEAVIDDMQKFHDRYALWYGKIIGFEKKYSDVSRHAIKFSGTNIKRNNLVNMPEIKYAPVGKSFNKDRLVNFVVIDTETTGLKASSERIIQLSAVKYADWEPVEVWNTYINPKRSVPKEASDINGITDDMLVDKPTIKQVADSFIEFVGNLDVVGYNLPFDLKFLFAEGIDLTGKKRKYYDVCALAKKKYKDDIAFFTLTDVAKLKGIYFNAHDSLNDCYATAEVFEAVIDDITISI